MALVGILIVCAYLLYRLVKAVEANQRPTVPEQPTPAPALSRRTNTDELKLEAFRETCLRDVMSSLGSLKRKYDELLTAEYMDGGHRRAEYVEGTAEMRSMLSRARLGVSSLLAGRIVDTDLTLYAAKAEALVAVAEKDVKELGYGEAVGQHLSSMDVAVTAVLRTGLTAFNSFRKTNDPTISEDESIAALKAMPHLLDEAHRATQLANLVFDVGMFMALSDAGGQKQ